MLLSHQAPAPGQAAGGAWGGAGPPRSRFSSRLAQSPLGSPAWLAGPSPQAAGLCIRGTVFWLAPRAGKCE